VDDWIRAANRVAGYWGEESAGKPVIVHDGSASYERSGAYALSWQDLGLEVVS
jgi:hypothetical protein